MKKLLVSPISWFIFAAVLWAVGILLKLSDAKVIWSSVLLWCGAGAVIAAVFLFILRHLPDRGAPVCVSLSPDTEKQMAQVDWSFKNVLVGTVRTAEQLEYSLRERRYYAPAKFFQNSPFPFDFVALHEEDIGTEPAIRWFAEVYAVQLLNREEIPVTMRPGANPQETYYCFCLQQWQQLQRPITILDSWRGRPGFTNQFLLANCTKSYQLFVVSNEKDFHLAVKLDKLYDELSATGKLQAPYSLGENHIIRLKGRHLLLTTTDGKIRDKTPAEVFLGSPRSTFNRIKKLLK